MFRLELTESKRHLVDRSGAPGEIFSKIWDPKIGSTNFDSSPTIWRKCGKPRGWGFCRSPISAVDPTKHRSGYRTSMNLSWLPPRHLGLAMRKTHGLASLCSFVFGFGTFLGELGICFPFFTRNSGQKILVLNGGKFRSGGSRVYFF